MPEPIRCAVLGGSGYIGAELIRLLLAHPDADLIAVTAGEQAGRRVDEVYPSLRGFTGLTYGKQPPGEADVYFLCLPHGEARRIAPSLPSSARLIDLSGDFRLKDPVTAEAHYGRGEGARALSEQFVYGVPEIHRGRIREARAVAVGGCFATCAILSCRPLVDRDLVDGQIIVDGKTGSSGSGRRPRPGTHHPERAGSLVAYEPFTHRHTPEISQALRGCEVIFQPHSTPLVRGVFTTSYLPLRREVTRESLTAIYAEAYVKEPFVRLVEKTPDVAHVRLSNLIDLSLAAAGRTAIVFGAIDNLIKGGAGQAVQCFNIMHGFPETRGLASAPACV